MNTTHGQQAKALAATLAVTAGLTVYAAAPAQAQRANPTGAEQRADRKANPHDFAQELRELKLRMSEARAAAYHGG
jgi:hypothetical protein